MNYMDLPKEYRKKNSKYSIMPVAYEKNTTYGKGASKGPEAIIKASKHLSYYDEEHDNEPFEKGIVTEKILKLNKYKAENAIKNIKEHYPKRFTIGLGGDHSTSIGYVRGAEKHHKNFSVLILDAHADGYYSWKNSRLNHACVARNLADKHTVGVIGVRSLDKDELEAIQEHKNMHVIKMHEYTEEKLEKLLGHLENDVYISIDADAFDPSIITNTGTPEPGGYTWKEINKILERVYEEKIVIGVDIVEFAPKNNFEAEAFTLAKLAYKLLALKERYNP